MGDGGLSGKPEEILQEVFSIGREYHSGGRDIHLVASHKGNLGKLQTCGHLTQVMTLPFIKRWPFVAQTQSLERAVCFRARNVFNLKNEIF